jgi:hypothetical protein
LLAGEDNFLADIKSSSDAVINDKDGKERVTAGKQEVEERASRGSKNREVGRVSGPSDKKKQARVEEKTMEGTTNQSLLSS